jgi:hypothetical protein
VIEDPNSPPEQPNPPPSADEPVPLTAQQERALLALLVASSVREAADKAECAERTLRRWLKDPGFAAAYQDARLEARRGVTNSLARVALKAITALERVIDREDSPPAAVVSAARAVLSELHGSASQEALEERVARLEAAGAPRPAPAAPTPATSAPAPESEAPQTEPAP